MMTGELQVPAQSAVHALVRVDRLWSWAADRTGAEERSQSRLDLGHSRLGSAAWRGRSFRMFRTRDWEWWTSVGF